MYQLRYRHQYDPGIASFSQVLLYLQGGDPGLMQQMQLLHQHLDHSIIRDIDSKARGRKLTRKLNSLSFCVWKLIKRCIYGVSEHRSCASCCITHANWGHSVCFINTARGIRHHKADLKYEIWETYVLLRLVTTSVRLVTAWLRLATTWLRLATILPRFISCVPWPLSVAVIWARWVEMAWSCCAGALQGFTVIPSVVYTENLTHKIGNMGSFLS